MKKLAQCPTWPALLDVETAILYLGGKPSRLYALICLGHLEPLDPAAAHPDFVRADIDAALQIARANREALVVADSVRSVSAALAAAKVRYAAQYKSDLIKYRIPH